MRPVVSPRTGFGEVLDQDDPVSFAVFSVLLGYFVVALGYSFLLARYWRQFGSGGGAAGVPQLDAGAPGIGSLAAAVPFIMSLTALTAMLLTGLYLMVMGRLGGARRPYGHWVGLAAFAEVPGLGRLAFETLRLAVGLPPADEPVLSLYRLAARVAGGTAGELGPFAIEFMRSVEPFQLWSLVVMAVGFSIYAARPLWSGVLVTALFWVLQVGLTAGWA